MTIKIVGIEIKAQTIVGIDIEMDRGHALHGDTDRENKNDTEKVQGNPRMKGDEDAAGSVVSVGKTDPWTTIPDHGDKRNYRP